MNVFVVMFSLDMATLEKKIKLGQLSVQILRTFDGISVYHEYYNHRIVMS